MSINDYTFASYNNLATPVRCVTIPQSASSILGAGDDEPYQLTKLRLYLMSLEYAV
ncbi:hypothetical protein [Microcoleus anatoxicus]|uniref:Uncharacterized protein n=1 Tax=Microcoleus anatoxicus PTRS2 TaxID=2705321 RepID=A0ABU8YUF6_9CYAN